MREITLKHFLNMMREGIAHGKRYCFILGSGASRSSQIPTGQELARQWSEELKEIYEPEELEYCRKLLEIKSIEPTSENYFNLYDLRFYPDYENGYAFLEQMMEHAKPSSGYYPLSKLLTTTKSNLVITTNFDSLVEDALFIYTDKKPIVASHESLAEFIDVNTDRPIVAKIHRGLFFKPLNRKEEQEDLSKNWQVVLKRAFQVFVPVVIGYAGGDHSLMKFLSDDELQFNGIYWCYRKEAPSADIQTLVDKKGGYFVSIDGFDEMMYMVGKFFSFEDPTDAIKETAKKRCEDYEKQIVEFSKRLKEQTNPSRQQEEILALLSEDDKKRLELLNERIAKSPEKANLYKERARLFGRIGRYEEGLADCNQMIRLDPQCAEAYHERAFVFYQMEKNEESLDDYNRAIDLRPDLPTLYLGRTYPLCAMQREEEAVKDCNRAIELDPENANVYNRRGGIFLSMKKYEEALKDLVWAIELQPDSARFYLNRAAVLKQKKQYREALSDLNRCVELDADNWVVYTRRAMVLYKMKKYGEALQDSRKAVELRQDNAVCHNNLGFFLMKAKQYDEAIASLEKAIELESEKGAFWGNYAVALAGVSRYPEAMEAAGKGVALLPDKGGVYRCRGIVHYEMGDYEAAVRNFDKSLSIEADNSNALLHRGKSYDRLGRLDEALSDLGRVIVADPAEWEAYEVRGKVYEKLGDQAKAEQDFQEAARLQNGK